MLTVDCLETRLKDTAIERFKSVSANRRCPESALDEVKSLVQPQIYAAH